MFQRLLDLTNHNYSLFLFGPRQTGKTHLIKHTLIPDLYINLLRQKEYLRYSRDFSLLAKEVEALGAGPKLVIIDEIQRLPELLNEVHFLMEEYPDKRFILTGSSARKLRRKGVNLLGGRALTSHLHPLTHDELGDQFSLDSILSYGSLPKIAEEKNLSLKQRLLKSYAETYLKEEIQEEALTRIIPAFARFLELAAFENGNLLNYTNIAREVGISAKTIKDYFTILEDTLIGFYLHPFMKSERTKLVAHPKFYFFDLGVHKALQGGTSFELIEGTPPYGNAFEHFVILEIRRLIDYRERNIKMYFFRTRDGAEVDLILELPNELWAIEIKSHTAPRASDLSSLQFFMNDHASTRAFCVCRTPRTYHDRGIEFINWKDFFKLL